MTEPQVWVLLGLFVSFAFGMVGVISGNFTRVLRAEIGGLRAETIGQIGELRAEMRGSIGELRVEVGGLRTEMNTRFEAVDARIDALTAQVQHLEADVTALTRRALGEH